MLQKKKEVSKQKRFICFDKNKYVERACVTAHLSPNHKTKVINVLDGVLCQTEAGKVIDFEERRMARE